MPGSHDRANSTRQNPGIGKMVPDCIPYLYLPVSVCRWKENISRVFCS